MDRELIGNPKPNPPSATHGGSPSLGSRAPLLQARVGGGGSMAIDLGRTRVPNAGFRACSLHNGRSRVKEMDPPPPRAGVEPSSFPSTAPTRRESGREVRSGGWIWWGGASPRWLVVGLEPSSSVGSEMGLAVGSVFYLFLIY